MKIIRKSTIWIASVILTFILLLIYHSYFQSQPPLDEMAEARSNLTNARANGALNYKKDIYSKANQYYDSAMETWARENDKFILFRDYSLSKYYADQANFWAEASTSNVKEMHNNHMNSVNEQLNSVKQKIDLFKSVYGGLPMDKSKAHQLAKARMLHREATISFNNKNWDSAEEKLKSSKKLLDKLIKEYDGKLKSYFGDFPKWTRSMDVAINESKAKGSKLLVIDKYDRKCHFYQNGKWLDSFDIELGANWMGDKQHAGDKTTPEGSYKILKKKSNGETRYYKAFLLDYPNDEDKSRFRENKAKGLIPDNTSIGNLIEIHGHGGKGHDWTDGCIALKDADMDKLFEECNEGTPIVIVGSTVPLDKILQ